MDGIFHWVRCIERIALFLKIKLMVKIELNEFDAVQIQKLAFSNIETIEECTAQLKILGNADFTLIEILKDVIGQIQEQIKDVQKETYAKQRSDWEVKYNTHKQKLKKFN